MRTFNVAALSAAAVLLPGAADGFISPAAGILYAVPSAAGHRCSTSAAKRTTRAPSMMASYADRLKEAQVSKAAAAANGGEPAPPHPPASSRSPPGDDTMLQVADSPFSPALQEELRVAIKVLAARLQREKPMNRAEFERFESAVGIIVEDALPLQDLPARAAAAAAAAAGGGGGGGGSAEPAKAPRRLVAMQSPVPPAAAASSNTDDDFEVEGPQWDAKKVQYGLPTGVRNTYDIDDMEKMNPDEYQAALREKVIKRAQTVRKSGSYGNIVSNEYLRFLGKSPKTGDEKFKENERFVKSKGREDFGAY